MAATQNILSAYQTATVLTNTASAIHTQIQKWLRLKTMRVSRWSMLKRMIWKMEFEDVDYTNGMHMDVEAGFVDPDYLDNEWEE